ncbi:hypothetical protein [Nannocystis radixulma]|uniref:Protein kinase domain-containing protein n=1 Tax=Nannocystis radixulma TaxID=2995305 RepID=A0ABT5BDH8_9BACT|nr:hypothetical protein [Nannocystis radixulma]MDC0672214.1 hypothetical protein [Nannocystis radixulma]
MTSDTDIIGASSRSSRNFMAMFAEYREAPADRSAATGAAYVPEEAEARRFAELVRDRYEIERELGRGGMGVVLLGRDRRLERHVALKLLPRSRGSGSPSQRRFLHEARTVARLSHPTSCRCSTRTRWSRSRTTRWPTSRARRWPRWCARGGACRSRRS